MDERGWFFLCCLKNPICCMMQVAARSNFDDALFVADLAASGRLLFSLSVWFLFFSGVCSFLFCCLFFSFSFLLSVLFFFFSVVVVVCPLLFFSVVAVCSFLFLSFLPFNLPSSACQWRRSRRTRSATPRARARSTCTAWPMCGRRSARSWATCSSCTSTSPTRRSRPQQQKTLHWTPFFPQTALCWLFAAIFKTEWPRRLQANTRWTSIELAPCF